MDTKVALDIVCIHCGALIHIQKKKSQTQCKLVCPGNNCHKNLHILFDTTQSPQTYSFVSTNVTKENEESENHSEQEERLDEAKKKAQKDKTIRDKSKHKQSHISHDDDDDEEEDRPKKSKNKPRLRETLYLTRKKYFGLVTDRYRLKEGKTIIGRADDDEPSDISLSGDDTMSRRSISIEIVADDYGFDYILRVLNAANPVKINGKQLRTGEKYFLEIGDTIKIGNTLLTFENS